jgi:hypothetical protein
VSALLLVAVVAASPATTEDADAHCLGFVDGNELADGEESAIKSRVHDQLRRLGIALNWRPLRPRDRKAPCAAIGRTLEADRLARIDCILVLRAVRIGPAVKASIEVDAPADCTRLGVTDWREASEDLAAGAALGAAVTAAARVIPRRERAQAAALTSPGTPAEVSGLSWRWPALLASGGLAAASLVAGSYFGARVNDYDQRAARAVAGLPRDSTGERICVEDAAGTCARLARRVDRLEDRGRAAETLQWTTLGVGGALLATAAGLLAWELLEAPAGGMTAVAPGDHLTLGLGLGERGGILVLRGAL